MDAYPGQVRLVLRYAPFHEDVSETAIRVLEAARRQDVFEPVLEALLARQSEWAGHDGGDEEPIMEIASEAGLDRSTAAEQLTSPEVHAVFDHREDVEANQIRKTPTFFVNGELVAPWTLALIAFVAVYREVFETVLFYQALWAQSGGGAGPILSGAGAAALLLVVAAWLIFRLGVRLPLKQFFGASAAVMVGLAVIFAGKGVVALQEAGRLPSDPVSFVPRIDLLGIYPTWQTLAVQLAMIMAAAALVVYNRRAVAVGG